MKYFIIKSMREKNMEEARRVFWRWVFVYDIDEDQAMKEIYAYYPENDSFEDFRNYMYHNDKQTNEMVEQM